MFSAAAVEKVGTVKAFYNYGGAPVPDGWLVCDGSEISRTTYAALFAMIGTTYGAGDGTTTFNLPNLCIPNAGYIQGGTWGNGYTLGLTNTIRTFGLGSYNGTNIAETQNTVVYLTSSMYGTGLNVPGGATATYSTAPTSLGVVNSTEQQSGLVSYVFPLNAYNVRAIIKY